jgi:hypothetical protein
VHDPSAQQPAFVDIPPELAPTPLLVQGVLMINEFDYRHFRDTTKSKFLAEFP